MFLNFLFSFNDPGADGIMTDKPTKLREFLDAQTSSDTEELNGPNF